MLESGEKVLVLLPTTTNKLLAQWQGPCTVVHKVGEVNYELYMPDKRKVTFHIKILKKWHQPDTTCLIANAVDPEKEDDMPSWRGENGKSPFIGIWLTEQQKSQLLELLSEFKYEMWQDLHFVSTTYTLWEDDNDSTVYHTAIERQLRGK